MTEQQPKATPSSDPTFNAATISLQTGGFADQEKSQQVDAGKTFSLQSKLPKLPIPKLEDTCKRYLESLKPLQSSQAHAKTEEVVAEFLKSDGQKLQKSLEDYASTRSSYIEEFWDDAYLQASDSVVLNLNPFFILEDDPTPSRGNQLMRTANLILASLAFVHDLRTGVLEPDTVRGTPLDMSQYAKLFGTARIPTENGCRMDTTPDSRHVVILRRGQFYWFEALDEQHRPLFTERALLGNLHAIVKDADQTPTEEVAAGAIGILSTENRKTWNEQREILKSDKNNSRCLEVVDKALFIVCMDDSEPSSPSELCNNMLCGTYELQKGVQVGTCTNRFYDKTIQLIVCKNGTAGINFEHTGVDGHTVLRFAADIYTELIMRFAKSINSATKSLFQAKTSPFAKGTGMKDLKEADEAKKNEVDQDTAPKKLEWTLTPEVKAAIKFGETRLSDLICQNECQVMEYTKYGKNFVTRHKFSPDAFVQMAFQAAYYTLYGRAETTYEPAMTKAFLHGRTEAIRTVQPWTVNFTKVLRSNAKPEDKLDALRKACEGHSKLSRACAGGQGHDRHLYAMLQLWRKSQAENKLSDPTPALFADSGYSTLNHTVISTSNCGNPALRLFGFGPVAPDGFGIGYIIKDDAISVCASSKHLQTKRFLETLEGYLEEIRGLIITTYKAANVRTQQTYIDHSGVECDVRTGEPIGSHQNKGNGYDDWQTSEGKPKAGGGYGFFDAGSEETQRNNAGRSNRNKLSGVGRTLIHTEYA